MGRILAVATISAFMLSGCPVLEAIKPPFSAGGVFDGSWTATPFGSDHEMKCVIQVILTHDIGAPPPNDFRVEGTITLNFSCTSVLEEFPDMNLPAAVSFGVTGIILPNGQLLLGSVQENEDGGTMLLGINAQGEDKLGDKVMDRVAGDFDVVMSLSPSLTLSMSGTFDAVHLE